MRKRGPSSVVFNRENDCELVEESDDSREDQRIHLTLGIGELCAPDEVILGFRY